MERKMFVLFVALLSACINAQFFENRRCRCVCPSPSSVFNDSTTNRQIYTRNVPAHKCTCEDVIFHFLGEELEGKGHIFCPRCDCQYQTRNTTMIMGVVFLIIIVVSVLFLYMAFLRVLNVWVGRRNLRGREMVQGINETHNKQYQVSEEAKSLLSEDRED